MKPHKYDEEWKMTETLTNAQLDSVLLLGQAIELRKRTMMVKANDGFMCAVTIACKEPQTRVALIDRIWKDVRLGECIGMWMCASLSLSSAPPFLLPRLVAFDHLNWFSTAICQPDIVKHVAGKLTDTQVFDSYMYNYFFEHFDPLDEADLSMLQAELCVIGNAQSNHCTDWKKAQDFIDPSAPNH